MKRFLIWLFWNACYLVRPRPTSWEGVLLRDLRTWWPCRKFSPYLWHNDDGDMWEIRFAGDADYTERRTLTLDVQVSLETGRIVGLNVFDELLEPRQPEPLTTEG